MFFGNTFYHFYLNPEKHRNFKIVPWDSAECLIKAWQPACVPLMSKQNIKKKIICLFDEFKKLKHAKKDLAALINFRNSIKTRFMISAKNAEILINKNKTLLPEAKAEDLQFFKLEKFFKLLIGIP